MSTKRKHKTDLAADIRRAIKERGLSAYRVAMDSGIDRSVAVRFINGERGLTLDTASKVCDMLGLELRSIQRDKAKGR